MDATFQSLTDQNGDPIFHLSTYGSDDRASEPKVSQTFQIDQVTAEALVKAMQSTFGDLDLGK